MKARYSDYIASCLRFYARYSEPKFKNDVEKKDWLSCDSVLKSLPETDREILMAIYADGDTLADCIFKQAKERGIGQDYIWKLIHDVERKIAERRGMCAPL